MRPEHSQRRALLLIPLAALFVVHPLIVHGCSCGHDFDFHLLNWMEAAKQIAHGDLHPHWAFTPAFNAGEPRFVFYPPLSWMLGALLGLLLTHLPGVSEAGGWAAAPILFTWVALTLSGLTLYRLARAFASGNAALITAIVYLANPYMLFTAYERTAYAELLTAAWFPLLLYAILRDRVTISEIALPVALLWLTNVPAAVMGSYTLALLAILRVVAEYRDAPATPRVPLARHRSSLLATNALAGSILGFGLAAFYILPVAYERRFVQLAMATVGGMHIDQNFLFEHTGTSSDALLHDQVLHTASLIAVFLLIGTAVALATAFIRRKSTQLPPVFPLFPLAVLTAGIALLLTPLSIHIWPHIPEADFLQFPWRLLAVLAPVFTLALARALTTTPAARLGKFSSRTFLLSVALVLTIALTLPAYHLFRQTCDPEDTAAARLTLFHSTNGSEPTDEYTPASADNDDLKPNSPPYWLADPQNDPAPTSVRPGGVPMHFSVTTPHSESLILNLRDYPAWHISLNGTSDPIREHRDDGLMAIAIPAGASTIDIDYTHTPDQTIGDAVSLVAFLSLLALVIRRRPYSQDQCSNP